MFTPGRALPHDRIGGIRITGHDGMAVLRLSACDHRVVGVFRPEVRYAHADDGAAIAYSVVGEGPVTIVLVSPLVSHVEVIWEEPALEHLISRLGVCSRVVLFDRRGVGLSDASPGPGEGAGLSRLAADVAAVLDGCDTGAAVLMGVTFGAQLALQFAADFPKPDAGPGPGRWVGEADADHAVRLRDRSGSDRCVG